MIRRALALVLTGAVLILLALPVAAANDGKWFVCKYVGTPGVDEVLQTGMNPISVDGSAIPLDPVVAGAIFADQQGRSLVLVADTGQTEPDPSLNCPELPPPPPPTPTPTPSPTPTASPTPTPSPSPTPTEPPGLAFSVTTCPLADGATASTDFFAGISVTALVIPEGQSAIRFSVARAALLITTLNVRIDGVLLTLENTLGDGTVGDRVVSPGLHTWSISNAADTAVLASGEILCPICNPTTAPPPATTPPDTAMAPIQGVGLTVGVVLALLGVLVLVNAAEVRRRR